MRRRGLRTWSGIRAVVTGASSGIGELLARRMAARGAEVVLVARRRDRLEQVAREIRAGGGTAHVAPCDVADRDSVFATARDVEQRLGDVDLLVNNAGYGGHRSFLEWDLDDLERLMRVNYLGTAYWTRALLPNMLQRRRGWLVFMASVAGRLGVPGESAYCASKFAVVGLAEALATEVEPLGIEVLTVCPGAVRTPFFDDEALRRMPDVARRRMVEPGPLVDAILNALERGKAEITYPRFIALGYLVRTLAPSFMRRQTARVAQPPSRG